MNSLHKTLLILRAGNTGRRGGQYGNKNAAKLDYETSPQEAEQWHDARVAEAEKNLHYGNIRDYSTTMNYYGVNSYLRGKSKAIWASDDVKWADMAAGMMKNFVPIDRDVQVYRGVQSKYVPDAGQQFSDSGFVSTSLRKRGGLKFLYDKPDEAVAQFTIQKGTPVAYANFMDEREIILPPGRKFEVLSKTPEAEASDYEGKIRRNKASRVELRLLNE